MKKFTILACTALLLFSCNSNSPEANENNQETEAITVPFELEFSNYSAAEDTCPENDCTHIDVRIPELKGGLASTSADINEVIDSLCRGLLKDVLPENLGNATYQNLCTSFIDGYQLFKMEFPDSGQRWHYYLNGDESFIGDDFFTLKLNIESFLGGAHPNARVIARSYDLETGEEIDVLSRYNTQQVRMLAEQYFREYHQLDPSVPLNDGGFLFENGNFTLPENIALSDSGIVLIYNVYEVASYAEGGTSFVLPYEVLGEK